MPRKKTATTSMTKALAKARRVERTDLRKMPRASGAVAPRVTEKEVIIAVNTALAAITATFDRHSAALEKLADAMHYDAEAQIKAQAESTVANQALFDQLMGFARQISGHIHVDEPPAPHLRSVPDGPPAPVSELGEVRVIPTCAQRHIWEATQRVVSLQRMVDPENCPTCGERWEQVAQAPRVPVVLPAAPPAPPEPPEAA